VTEKGREGASNRFSLFISNCVLNRRITGLARGVETQSGRADIARNGTAAGQTARQVAEGMEATCSMHYPGAGSLEPSEAGVSVLPRSAFACRDRLRAVQAVAGNG
jgi:hypothetical protein